MHVKGKRQKAPDYISSVSDGEADNDSRLRNSYYYLGSY